MGEHQFDMIRAGDVVVCPITSPTWSVVFPSMGALVTDGGGILSHPAIIAREHGIPQFTVDSHRPVGAFDVFGVHIGGTVTAKKGEPITLTIQFRDPDAKNAAGENPRVSRVDIIMGQIMVEVAIPYRRFEKRVRAPLSEPKSKDTRPACHHDHAVADIVGERGDHSVSLNSLLAASHYHCIYIG